MTWHWIHILPMVLLLPSVLSSQCKSSTHGREFVFGILDTIDENYHDVANIVALDITNVSPVDTTIRVLIPYFSNDTTFDIPQGEKRTIEIDPKIQKDGTFVVTQYGVNNLYDNSEFGDAFMAVVPSIDQYLNDYIFTVPHGYYDVKYYAAVIVPEKYKDGLLYDSIAKQSYKYSVTVLNVPPPLDDYIVLTFQVDPGFHHFRQTSVEGNFGLFVYGLGTYSGTGLGNGFYAGFNLKGDCLTSTATTDVISTQTPYETMTLTSRQTETVVNTMVAANTTDTSKPTNSSGQLCFVCADLSHLDLCERVEQCNQNEVCYLEKYMESGHTKYKSGCMDARTCQTKGYKYSHSEEVCFECCNANYCNNKGCGEDIPDRDRRGPICFDCEHVSSPDECFKVFPCNSDEVCRIEEYKWFGHSNFKMGCGQGVCDPVQRAGGHRLKRATPVCLSCCAEDFCNRNCTHALAGQGGSIIVG